MTQYLYIPTTIGKIWSKHEYIRIPMLIFKLFKIKKGSTNELFLNKYY